MKLFHHSPVNRRCGEVIKFPTLALTSPSPRPQRASRRGRRDKNSFKPILPPPFPPVYLSVRLALPCLLAGHEWVSLQVCDSLISYGGFTVRQPYHLNLTATFHMSTEMANKDGTWLREISSCCCLTTAGKTRQLLLKKIYIPFLPSLYHFPFANSFATLMPVIWPTRFTVYSTCKIHGTALPSSGTSCYV